MMPASVRALVAAFLIAGAGTAGAQLSDTAFADLRRDGNGIDALRTPIGAGFEGTSAAAALTAIAALARLNVTFDPRLPALAASLAIPPHVRPAAVALLEVAAAAAVRVRVAPTGQIIVIALLAPTPVAKPMADSSRSTARLPAVRTDAPRTERQQFNTQTNVGVIGMTGSALGAAPVFVEPDLLRSVQMLPGIAARSDYSAGFNVRGGENDQNLILMDGYPIYNPYHLGGVFSTFIEPAVGGVSLYRGALPVRYDGRLSGVLDVNSAEPTTPGVHGTAEVSLVSSTASLGGAIAEGNGSWFVAARRTYADMVVNLFYPGAFPYHFQDIQGHFTRRFANGLRLSLTAYNGLDATASHGNDDVGASWGNSVVGATVSKQVEQPKLFGHQLGDSLVVEQRLSVTRFDSHIDIANYVYHASDRITDNRAAGSLTLARGRLTQTAGYELSSQKLGLASSDPFSSLGDFLPFDSTHQRARSAGAYVDELWRPSSSLIVEGGVRVDAVNARSWVGALPRASIKYFLTGNTAVTVAAGEYAQWMHSLGREEEPVEPLQFWVASDSAIPLSHARDATIGAEHWLTPSRFLHVEAFYKRYTDALVPNALSDPGVHGDEFLRARGTSYGADLMLRQLDGGPFSGWLAYSYGVSARVRSDGVHYFPPQDRRHNLNLVGSWRRGPYTFAAHANFASGMPYTPLLGAYTRMRYSPLTGAWTRDGSFEQQTISGALDSSRLPGYDRVDMSITRAAHLFGLPASLYLSILNVLNSRNPAAYVYDFNNGFDSRRASVPNLPLAPTFGVRIVY